MEYLKQQKLSCTILKCDWESEKTKEASDNHHQKSLNQIFNKGIKPKKQHELRRMSETCVLVSSATNCQTIVDIGAGVGHLSRRLSFEHGLKVIGLECQDELNNQAKKQNDKYVKMLSKFGTYTGLIPRHVTLSLSPDTTNLKKLLDSQMDECISEFGLVGLHTCGDLGPTLIRNFVLVPEIRFILAIGCCYMKMNIDPYLPLFNYYF